VKRYTHDLFDLEGAFVQNVEHEIATRQIKMAVERYDGTIGMRLYERGERVLGLSGTRGFRYHQKGPTAWGPHRMPDVVDELRDKLSTEAMEPAE